MRKSSRWYPSLKVDGNGTGVVAQAGAVALARVAAKTGLDQALSQALAPWRTPLAVHDPGKIVLDLAMAVALGGDCAADIALLRNEPGVFGSVASGPTVSRLVTTLAADAAKVLSALRSARARARAAAWRRAGEWSPDHAIDATDPLVIDLPSTQRGPPWN
ncbi:IS1380 family transposase IS1676 [Nocardia sp. RB56]|uniref:IS1380 family transposase IS1676 n=1 Tax=Nocardia aurantia TaxID=2585199 RepID=A0A7K0E092_9NOCA|nr:IS1380 family transposase IS1676 [Nocardia aurantia]